MTGRENMLRALRRDNPDYIPFSFELCESLREEFKRRTMTDDYMEYYGMDHRYVWLGPSRAKNDYTKYHPNLPEGAVIGSNGVAHKRGSIAHFSHMFHPMEKFETADEVCDYPWDDIDAEYRFEGLEDKVSAVQASGKAVVYSAIQIFEPAWYLRGLDNLLCDMLTDNPIAEALMEKLTRQLEAICRRLSKAGVDIILFGDDVGTQKSMMMSREMWRRWVMPYTARVIAAAKEEKPDVLVKYHSDGVIDPIVDDLIDIGVEILNPVQPECMNPAAVKEQYGERLSFWGTIGTQTTMPFDTPDGVRRVVRERIETVGRGGGLVIAPTHLLEPEVSFDNIEAFVSAVREYGRY